MKHFSLGLIGYPLGHSLSPQMQLAALRAVRLSGEYRLYPIPPAEVQDGLFLLAGAIRRGELDGLNITIPHKTAIVPLLDELTPAARAIGAVNCVYRHFDALAGDNTDAAGFRADLQTVLKIDPIGRGREALVLGAGGAARAIVYSLAQDGWKVLLAARDLGQARLLADHFNRLENTPGDVTALPLEAEALEALLSSPRRLSLMVNATPVGMYPDRIEQSPWPHSLSLPAGVAVYDLVYRPAETALVRSARRAGLRADTGLGMLVEQAALSFERWTGIVPPREALRAAAQEALE